MAHTPSLAASAQTRADDAELQRRLPAHLLEFIPRRRQAIADQRCGSGRRCAAPPQGGSSITLALVLASPSGIPPHAVRDVPFVAGIPPCRPCALGSAAGTYGYSLDCVPDQSAAAP